MRASGVLIHKLDFALPVSLFLLRTLAFAFVLTLLRSGADVLAQGYPSEQGRFTVNQVRGCADLKVEIIQENIPPGNTSPRIYKFNYDGNLSRVFVNEDQTSKDTTYAIPGTYKILQVVGDELDSITIEVLEPRPPQFQVYNCINNSIYLEVSEAYYDRLQIDFGDGITMETAASSIVYPYSVAGEYTVTVRGIFDDASSENCATADTTILTITGLTMADLTAVTVESNTSIRVAYQLPNPNVSYRLEVSEAGSNDFSLAQYDLDTRGEFLLDDPLFRTREQSYCFRVVAVNRCDESLNLPSETLCSIALQAEAQDVQNQLTWQTPGALEYRLFRDGEPLVSTSDSEFLDTDVECQQDYQYQVLSEKADGASTSATITLTATSNTVSPSPDSVQVQITGQPLQVTWRLLSGITTYYVYRGQDEQAAVLYDSVRAEDVVLRSYEDADVDVGRCLLLPNFVRGCLWQRIRT